MPTIISSLRAGLKDVRAEGNNAPASNEASRIERDMPMSWVIAGSAVIILLLFVLLTIAPVQDAHTTWYQNLLAGILVVIFGFLFVTVASRISGLLGNSSNPVSGMSIGTLMATCAIFLLAGWTAPSYGVLALTIGGSVCIAAAIAGATSQALKTGYLVGATPARQQSDLLVGVTVSAFAVGAYLSIGTTATMFAGGLVRVLVEATTKKKEESEASPGALYSSGLIAAGGVFGLLGIVINLLQDPEIPAHVPHWLTTVLRLPWRTDHFAFGPKIFGSLATSNLFGLIMFLILAASLFYFARQKLDCRK